MLADIVIFNGKQFAQEILDKEVRPLAKEGKFQLDIIWIGDSAESEAYIRHKQKAAQEVGINVNVHQYPISTAIDEILALQKNLNNDPNVTGYFFQLPIPPQIDRSIFRNIDVNKDVDGLNPVNLGLLWQNQSAFTPAAASAVMRILNEDALVDLEGKNVVIINDSIIVGKPLSALLLKEKATVSICTKYTQDLNLFTNDADIIISATGKPGLINSDMVKDGVVLIDVGTRKKIFTEKENKKSRMFGDIDFDSCSKKAAYITPVPGGVGPVTVACLLLNVCLASQK